MSIASELQTLIANKIAIKNAILAKSPATPPGDNLANWPTSIESISEAESDNPVKFRDCDGTILHSYTVAEVASMSNLPPLPTRDGLTCQGWNWTLQQIKDYVASYGKCEIGATYTTDDGKTRIKLTIQDKKYTKIPIVFQQTVANGVKVNWGDGSADETYSSTSQQTIDHTYTPSAYPATYTITFEVISGKMSFPTNIMGNSGTQSETNPIGVWNNMIDEVNIGNGVTSIGDYAFGWCFSLTSITIPNSVTSIGNQAFQYCYSITSIAIPSSVNSIGARVFYRCYGMKTFDFRRCTKVPTLSNVSAFQNTPTDKEIVVPDGLYGDWIAATNWSQSTNQIKESIVKASESTL